MDAQAWRRRRRFDGGAFPPEVLARRGADRIAVCLPARDEAATVGGVLRPLVDLRDRGLVDRVVVADGGSRDDTAGVARAAGAEVLDTTALQPGAGPVLGKGDTVWRALAELDEEIVVWLDADLEAVEDRWVSALAGPLLADAEVQLVKGSFERPRLGAGEGAGRVTELTARPLLLTFYPELAVLRQPLSGQSAVRRAWAAEMPLPAGYGLEMAVLLETWSRGGLAAIAECHLGTLLNRHQPLERLVPMAVEVLDAVAQSLRAEGRLDAAAPAASLRAAGAVTARRPPVAGLEPARAAPGARA